MSKKLLFITTRLFFTTNSGRKLSLYHYCRGLHEKYGYKIYIYSFLEGDQIFEEELKNKPDFIHKIYKASDISKLNKLNNLLFLSLFSKKWPLQCSLYYSKKNLSNIKKLCNEYKFDVVITDMIRTSPYIKALENINLKILDMDDLLSKRYEREILIKTDTNFIGQYSKKLPNYINKLLPKLKTLILKYEISKLKFAETYYAKLYDKVIFVSENETNELNSRLKINKCVTVTTGIDFDYFSEDIEVIKEKNSISFIGNMEYPPNIDSLKIIVNQILPYVSKPIKVYVVGKVTKELRAELGNKVQFLGMVEDFRSVLKSSELFLAPIAYGSGIKTKILEAMAMGLPVLTNSVGAEGINVVSGKNAVISDDMFFLANEIDRLLDNENERNRIGIEGQNLVKNEYQWNDIWEKFKLCGLGE